MSELLLPIFEGKRSSREKKPERAIAERFILAIRTNGGHKRLGRVVAMLLQAHGRFPSGNEEFRVFPVKCGLGIIWRTNWGISEC